jgi:asparagine synthase (glutamine-hydrolysing)
MISTSGQYTVTFNGEIYNFRELRTELEGRGVRFRGLGRQASLDG